MKIYFLSTILISQFMYLHVAFPQERPLTADPLSYAFDGHRGQVEVGGPFVGVEFHASRPLPSRISFYYPVANSIDLSTDYWKRGESMPMAIGLNVDGGSKHWIGREPWSYVVSPHMVIFHRIEKGLEFSIRYEFCLNEPAMVRTIIVKSTSIRPHKITLYTHMKPALRTCQTYTRIDSARTRYIPTYLATVVEYDDPTAGSASVFIEDVGMKPAHVAFDSDEIAASDSGTSRWLLQSDVLSSRNWEHKKHVALVASVYHADLQPKDSLQIIQVIGTCRKNEVEKIAGRLSLSWYEEVAAYQKRIVQLSETASEFKTGDQSLDASAVWAKGLLAANAHYLDSQIVPMPCPAEYNFFFTHDVLMTDLGAVNFDLRRVHKDLFYIASLAKENVIPHAYYWRDNGFKTEYCTPDNWNHFWFILTTGAYLRHSLDSVSGFTLYPVVTKSLEEILTQIKADHLMHAFRPDWWDIGHLEGPRAYTTILAIRALREYLYISSFLRSSSNKLMQYEALADSMQVALTQKLWNSDVNYLMNFNDGEKDKHFYMGSLLAVAFGLLDYDKSRQLLETASHVLLDTNLGVRTAMPPDFNTPASIGFYKFAGEEAGKPFFYINGGVWPHDNSWYALGLVAMGQPDEALRFVQRTMTLDGIVNSPNGQPAMYEYRFADPGSRDYGMIDKPSFLWAGGFYLKTLYALFALRENEWNLSFDGSVSHHPAFASYSLEFGNEKTVHVRSNGKYLDFLGCDSTQVPSAVLPLNVAGKVHILNPTFDTNQHPYLRYVNAILHTIRMDSSRVLTCEISSFVGHTVSAIVVSPIPPKRILVDGISSAGCRPFRSPDNASSYEITFIATATDQQLRIIF